MLSRTLPIAALLLGLAALPARAVPQKNIARYSPTEAREIVRGIRLYSGRGSYIQWPTGYSIQSVFLPDRSRTSYNTNVPIPTGRASILYLNPIDRQDFPGATTAGTPNISVAVRDPNGNLVTHVFNLHFAGSLPDRIVIDASAASPSLAVADDYIRTEYGQANVNDLEAGLQAAIARESLDPYGETATEIRAFAARWRNESLLEAMGATDLGLETLVALARAGQVRRAQQGLRPALPPEDPELQEPGAVSVGR